ncbi:cytosolic factor, phosphatidylinositol/phosphatidylcholine transfer protein [Tulasnella sp. 330]|nr:cytosolic factor, phosphatidylinositol/phosphatidylcholine transfer protein [Tulasnella sp. 330]KAG8883159.1 cytosolic factor, phosphatidylinositol/phosphatidylcholine transfer protein [Tulasnella sp. 331]KAG8888463.1 cytosolic factor, phosphatidylinositol/phosphatidylcholine transfer protein [Tulasnella sp. 332]
MPPSTQPPADPLSGRVGHLSVTQQHTLDKFKKELQDEGWFVPARHDDAALLRFLRARKFDLIKAKIMIIDQEKWRKEFGTDELLHFDFPEKEQVDKYYPQYYHKTDKDGRPVYIEQLGRLDIDALYKITTQDRLLKRLVSEYEIFVQERLPATSAAVGHPVETSCTILDLKNVSIRQFYKVKDYVSQASSIGQNEYPECMGKFYIINAPFMFSTVWSLIKPWLDEVTVAKISILGSDYKPKLLEQIPADNLPEELGGTCKCPGGCSLSDAGPWNNKEAAPLVVQDATAV